MFELFKILKESKQWIKYNNRNKKGEKLCDCELNLDSCKDQVLISKEGCASAPNYAQCPKFMKRYNTQE